VDKLATALPCSFCDCAALPFLRLLSMGWSGVRWGWLPAAKSSPEMRTDFMAGGGRSVAYSRLSR
jgi:hypothetical protein